VECASPLKANVEGVCVADWSKLSSALPSGWANTVANTTASSEDYDDLFKADSGNFLSSLAEGGTLEDLQHAVNLIKHVGLNVSDYLEIATSVPDRKSNITPFLRAVLDLSAEGPKKLALLASLGANTKHENSGGSNVLSYSAVYGSANTLQFILDQGYVNYNDSRTNTGSDPLLSATFDEYTSDQLEKLKILTAFNPTAAVTRSDRYNIFMAIAGRGSPDAVRYVLDTFPFVDTKDGGWSRSAPMYVAYHRDPSVQVEILTMILDAGFDPNQTARSGYNLLHWFCQVSASRSAIEFLVEVTTLGAFDFSINTRNWYNSTALTLLQYYNSKLSSTDRTATYNYLVSKGATRSFTEPDTSEDVAALPTE
jgi:hypothetical protein